MLKIRKGVFETNSSSTHSLTMCSDEEWKAFEKQELLFDRWDDSLVPVAELFKEYPEAETVDDIIEQSEGQYWTLDTLGGDYFEYFHETYSTKSGEEIHAFGYYGSDY